MKYHQLVLTIPLLFASPSIGALENEAQSAIDTIQKFYNSTSGLWQGVSGQLWWESANILTAIAKFGLHDPEYKPTAVAIIDITYQKSRTAPKEVGGYIDWKNKFTDDMGWWALAWIASFDLTGDKKYLDSAKDLYQDMQINTATQCGGLIKWNKDKKAITAISNELFLSIAAHLANRIPGDGGKPYRERAERQWQDFKKAGGFINGRKLVNDAIHAEDCTNNGDTTWTYNQGVILGGLAELTKATGNGEYGKRAIEIADSAMKNLATNGILTEQVPSLDQQGAQFKGAFVRGLAALNAQVPEARFATFLKNNAESAWTRGKQGELIGGQWQGGGGFIGTTSQASGVDVLVAAAQANPT
ncbi:glycosyl hydrolase [Dendryphion nanum]|uniref:Glycosyl hydrolase n=1 Tax=Dendryphion nanum TaxID=256645 RepID=A0A9P9IK24_9PLEO|nr:glycosyl hydrolase [Dendryphion nanum]